MAIERTDTKPREEGDGRLGGLPPIAMGPIAAVAASLAVLLTALSGRYGFHRDELYFMVAGDHPDWGYVDQPPLTPLLARVSTALLGDSPAALRVVATILCVAAVVTVALIARELGGDRRTQTVAACCAAASGIVLGLGHLLATATFDMLAWLVISLLVLRLLRTGDGRWFVAIGLAVGVGMENKQLLGLLVVTLFLALLLVGPRDVLRTRWLPIGALIAAVIAAPNLIWSAAHGWPQFAVAAGISEDGADDRVMLLPLLVAQLSPLFLPIWVAGLVRLWRDPSVRWARLIPVATVLLFAVVLFTGGKAYYVLPLLMVSMAAGVAPVVRWARPRVLVAGIAVAAAVNVVIGLPVLPPAAAGLPNALNAEVGEQIGWPEFVRSVADAWNRIPEADRARAVIFAQNYGEAAAIARYGPEHGLPAAYSGHMSYADWGPPPDTADGPVLLVHAAENRRIPARFTDCRLVGPVDIGYDIDNQVSENVIRICGPAPVSWSALWPSLRNTR
ncbi:glycosyltransferase family 39 protein [Herbidospora cretacea]|uniref:glycosyltransferase family 39 protein n=1 Tax=Herbidospora cretacea TaxID=28444 RepID=UPI0018CC1BCB|nr:glycosyltransferase family 39 protein [Herbidospora cretacea]